MRRLLEEGKGNWCFGGEGKEKRGAENTDGNYRNRNAEDKKSHTDGVVGKKKILHSHVRKCTFKTKKKHAYGPTCSDSETSRWMKKLKKNKIGLLTATQAACNTAPHN